MYIKKEFPEAGRWNLDGSTGWFVAFIRNVLYKYDTQKNMLSIVSFIPTKNEDPYQYVSCVKKGDQIYCFPEYESSIWCYDVISEQWKKISICESDDIPAMIFLLGEYSGVCYFFSCTYKTLYGFDLQAGKVIESYLLDVEVTCKYYIHGIISDGKVYLVLGGTSLYEFDLETHIQKEYIFPDFGDILFRIEADGDTFWIIGKKQCVYRWKKGNDEIRVLMEFPKEISLYDYEKKMKITEFDCNAKGLFVFNSIHCLNGKIWIIPMSASKIVYFAKDDMVIKVFDISEDEETERTLDLRYRRVAAKYALMYIRQERYLGIYSCRNKQIFEIDTSEMTYQTIHYDMDQYSLAHIPIQEFYDGQNELMDMIFSAKINHFEAISDCIERKVVGQIIHKEILEQTV